MKNASPNNPYSLFVAPPDHEKKCSEEDNRDIRHLGRYLTFEYTCPNCGIRQVELPPDYPYCGPNNTWPCSHCAAVMRLNSAIPLSGIPKSCMSTILREDQT